MKKKYLFRKLYALFLASFLFGGVFAQSLTEGDALITCIGKGAESEEVKKLESDYKCEMVNPDHYHSKTGIDITLLKGKLRGIIFYKTSQSYGDFTSKLPKGLVFGMTPAEVRKELGTPTIEYIGSGYSEFEREGYVISCWYDDGLLSQVSLTLKN